MMIPEGLKPDVIWKLLEYHGFQILVQKGQDEEQDRPCVRISCSINGHLVSIAIRGFSEDHEQKVFDLTDDPEACFKAILTQIEPMLDVLIHAGD